MKYVAVENRDRARTIHAHEIGFNGVSELYDDNKGGYVVAVKIPQAHEECGCTTEVEFNSNWKRIK